MPSQKLEYEKQEPAFLRKLREQHGGPRNNVQFARPKKERLRTGDEGEDDPVIVDETGEDVAKDVWEERLRKEKEGISGGDGQEVDESDKQPAALNHDTTREKQKTAEIGAAKKRKVAKVIADEESSKNTEVIESSATSVKTGADTVKTGTKEIQAKPKKKAKKIKLSFDDPE